MKRCLLAVLALLALGISLQPGAQMPDGAQAQTAEPFLEGRPVVALSDRLVCTLPGSSKAAAGIVGKDTGGTVEVNGTVYWTFGDTTLVDGRMIPNTIAWSDDRDASDCIDLVPKQVEGRAEPLLSKEEGELTVWPSGLEETSPGLVDFFYTSVEPGPPPGGWQGAGVGVASLDVATLTAQRELGGALLWTGTQPWPASTFSYDGYVYIILSSMSDRWTSDVRLARVPQQSVTSPEAYEYWDAGYEGEPGHWVSGLWNEDAGTWDQAINDLEPLWKQSAYHNGVEIAYNEFLGRWLAVYSAGYFTSVTARAADAPTGPWDAAQTPLVSCENFHPTPLAGYQCYSGTQHPYYSQDGGRTIYVSYANTDSYSVFLHEVRLAARITQWTDGSGHAVYLPQGADAPDGYVAEGTAFHASDIPLPTFAAIHRWQHPQTGQARYAATPPEPQAGYQDAGVAFYAPVDAAATIGLNTPYVPVYRWQGDGVERYSSLDLSRAGYTRQEAAFYAPCPDSDGDSLSDCEESAIGTNAHAEDTDLDGCADALELGSSPQFGGGRDPLNFWDFYDTPDGHGHRDSIVSISDLSQVVSRFGARGDRTASPLTDSLFPPPAYHPAFDRGGGSSGNAQGDSARNTAADGVIGIGDIGGLLNDFGHNCVPASWSGSPP